MEEQYMNDQEARDHHFTGGPPKSQIFLLLLLLLLLWILFPSLSLYLCVCVSIFPPLENHIITRVQSTLLLPQSCLPTASMTKPWRRSCDLCKTAAASVHCDSDDAFLCLNCDSHVHEANFLVARHLRKTICSSCHQIDSRGSFSGAKLPPFHRTICSECLHHHSDSASDDSSSSFSSSSCISAADNTDSEIQRWRRRRKRKTRRTDVSGVPSKHVFLNESSCVDDEGWGESSSSSSTS